ncbi:hypothetical protein [Flavobacterium sp. C4GT6]|uniref:hypothetical protein n=1 Tax=Flavobacterium sp. C4GT6 TaxID=3103818 RepID=UPI002ED0A71C
MKKTIVSFFALFVSIVSFSQTGIGTVVPHESAVLDLSATDKALLLSRVDNTGSVTNPENGMVIYDKTDKCIKVYQDNAWSGCIYISPGSVTGLDCTGVPDYGELREGEPAVNVYSVISYTGGDGAYHTGQTVTSTGVTGLTATLVAGSFANGDASLTYTITGTPSSVGTASFAVNIGGQSCTLTREVLSSLPAIASLDCAGAVHNGALEEGIAASGVSSVIAYSGGDGSAHTGETVTSTGVTGLTATLNAGNFANGDGSLIYTITGTPSSVGTASFAVNIGGQSCVLTRTVVSPPPPLPVIPSTITLAPNRTYTVASVYDQDYLPYTAPSGPATTAVQAADGSNETVTLNVQGSITTAGISVTIPVTATGSGTLPAYSTTISIPAGMTEDGVGRDLTLSWSEQGYTSSTTAITATIAAVGGILNAKKLDVNTGVGSDYKGVLMGQFNYPYNSAGDITNYDVRVISGIPDKMFGLPDNTGSTTTHQMLYLPVVGEDGNIWLNNNLGAHYANLNHADFNPAQQATAYNDYLAYGSLFQWGRKADGHELITYTSGTAGTAVNGTTTTKSDTPTHALFIRSSASPYDWRATPDDTLWTTESSTNNPCPVGFRVPTIGELTTLVTTANITNRVIAANSVLKFTVPGLRSNSNGMLSGVGSYGDYWSSSVGGTEASFLGFNSGGTYTLSDFRAYGFSVRCIKD